MRLIEIRKLDGKISLKTGLHIGAGDMEMHIGGTDNPIVKHPHTLEPYIPGSSLKGKVRSLLELKSGLMGETRGSPLSVRTMSRLPEGSEERKDCVNLVRLFGSSGAETQDFADVGPTRASFSDCYLDEAWRQYASDNRLPLVELKSENSINRITGTAQNPRFTERATVGCRFSFSIFLKVFEADGEELQQTLLRGLRLLEMDSLGGSGSRGYGRVIVEFDDSEIESSFRSTEV